MKSGWGMKRLAGQGMAAASACVLAQRRDRGLGFAQLLALLCLLTLGQAAMATETVVYYHTDALGSPVAVTDASGNVIERSEYEPYGKLLNRPLEDGPGYTGHVSDAATGLSYMQQRYYDPAIGRYLSVDPVSANSGVGFNRYSYAANNPYRYYDPDGRAPKSGSTPPPADCGDQPCPSRRERKEQRDRERNSDIIITHTRIIGSTSVQGAASTDGIAKATETIIREFTDKSNHEACAGFCPIQDDNGDVTGYTSTVVTQDSHAWCVPTVTCANGAPFQGVNHSHAFRSYAATPNDASINTKIIAGRLYQPGVIFSKMDKGVPNIYLILKSGLYNYSNGERRQVP